MEPRPNAGRNCSLVRYLLFFCYTLRYLVECFSRQGHLNNLEYTVCIKEAHGYCGIAYSALNFDDFQMSGILDYSTNPDLEGVPPLFGEASCYEDYIFISRGHHPEVEN